MPRIFSIHTQGRCSVGIQPINAKRGGGRMEAGYLILSRIHRCGSYGVLAVQTKRGNYLSCTTWCTTEDGSLLACIGFTRRRSEEKVSWAKSLRCLRAHARQDKPAESVCSLSVRCLGTGMTAAKPSHNTGAVARRKSTLYE